jgi:hypothetical protein
MSTVATPAMSGPPLRRRRPRPLDALLVAVGIVVLIATISHVADVYRLRSRGPADGRALLSWAARNQPGHRFAEIRVVRSLHGLDAVCAAHASGRRYDYRQCLLVRRSGPIAERSVGGYRRPITGYDRRGTHYACFGRAVTLHQCLRGRLGAANGTPIGPIWRP